MRSRCVHSRHRGWLRDVAGRLGGTAVGDWSRDVGLEREHSWHRMRRDGATQAMLWCMRRRHVWARRLLSLGDAPQRWTMQRLPSAISASSATTANWAGWQPDRAELVQDNWARVVVELERLGSSRCKRHEHERQSTRWACCSSLARRCRP